MYVRGSVVSYGWPLRPAPAQAPPSTLFTRWLPGRLVDGGVFAGQEEMGVQMVNADQTVDLVEALRRAGNPRVAASQRLRRLLQEVSMRSRCGAIDSDDRRSLVGGVGESGLVPESAGGGE
jgi:hypothetical protein